MRTLLCVAVLATALLAAAPSAKAQFGFFPLIGYDIDYEAFQAGLGFEIPVTPGILPVSAAIRPSVEYVFLGDIEGLDISQDLFRVNGDIVGRFSPPLAPVGVFGKAGVGIEVFSVDDPEGICDLPGNDCSDTSFGANLGGGVVLNSLFIEGTVGLGNISTFRINAGYRF